MTLDSQSAALLGIVCAETFVEKVAKIVRTNCPHWRVVPTLVISDHWKDNATHVAQKINLRFPASTGAIQIIVCGDIDVSALKNVETEDLRVFRHARSIKYFQKILPEVLRSLGLDKATYVHRQISSWIHGTISRDDVNIWLKQFDSIGERPLGEGIYTSIDMWSPDRLMTAINLDSSTETSYDWICVNRAKPGKSADILSNIVNKRMTSFNGRFRGVHDFRDRIDSTPASEKILFIEDGIFSGTEILHLFRDLLGLPISAMRKRKVTPIVDEKKMRDREITLVFPVATSVGIGLIRQYLVEHKLTNIDVKFCSRGFLDVLAPAGRDAIEKGGFYSKQHISCPKDSDSFFIRHLFCNMKLWKSQENADRVKKVCRIIGKQLMSNFITSKGWFWNIDKIEMASLGMFDLALTTCFSHSIPRATLPLIWGRGPVDIHGRRIEWSPLFPNA